VRVALATRRSAIAATITACAARASRPCSEPSSPSTLPKPPAINVERLSGIGSRLRKIERSSASSVAVGTRVSAEPAVGV
jgi:hypothetical protein